MLEQADVDPAHVYAFSKTGRLVSEENKDALSPAEVKEWKSAVHEYSRHLERQQKAIETCFVIRARTKIPREEWLASDEIAIAAMYACESGACSFAVEGILLNAWLTLVAKRMGITTTAAQGLREILSGGGRALRGELQAWVEVLETEVWSEAMLLHIAKIETLRALPDTWLGRPPVSEDKADREMAKAFAFVQDAIHNCHGSHGSAHAIESMVLRGWLRMAFLNDRLPEPSFQRRDAHWPKTVERVNDYLLTHLRVGLVQ